MPEARPVAHRHLELVPELRLQPLDEGHQRGYIIAPCILSRLDIIQAIVEAEAPLGTVGLWIFRLPLVGVEDLVGSPGTRHKEFLAATAQPGRRIRHEVAVDAQDGFISANGHL